MSAGGIFFLPFNNSESLPTQFPSVSHYVSVPPYFSPLIPIVTQISPSKRPGSLLLSLVFSLFAIFFFRSSESWPPALARGARPHSPKLKVLLLHALTNFILFFFIRLFFCGFLTQHLAATLLDRAVMIPLTQTKPPMQRNRRRDMRPFASTFSRPTFASPLRGI